LRTIFETVVQSMSALFVSLDEWTWSRASTWMKRAWLNNRRVDLNVRLTNAYFCHQLFIRSIY